jgi:hypothetical protein
MVRANKCVYVCRIAYADVKQVDISSENINVIVEHPKHDLEKVSNWMSANQLTLIKPF